MNRVHMTARKRRILFSAVAAFLCVLVFFVITNVLQKRDKENFQQYAKYEGVWQSADGKLTLKVYRVTSGTLSFSLNNKRTHNEIPLSTAYSIGNGYEFSYAPQRLAGPVYYITAGNSCKGSIYPEEDKIRIDIPQIPDKPHVLEFQGTLARKSGLPEEETVHLMEYMNTKKQLPETVKKYCSLLTDEEGNVWRIRVRLAGNIKHRKTDIGGISLCTTESECERLFGEAVESVDLAGRRKKKVYEKDGYCYTIVQNPFGVIEEADCRKKELSGTVQKGEFLMKGNTVFRYTGDIYSGDIVLPEGVNRIASHAFELGDNGCFVTEANPQMRKLSLATGIYVEEDAFRNCGPMCIELEKGWKVVSRRAFAHTVSLENMEKKETQVIFMLPETIERIEEEAFAIDNSSERLRTYWREWEESDGTAAPVELLAYHGFPNVSYIGDNALWGMGLSFLPEKATFLGKNITLTGRDTVSIPEGITVLRSDNFYFTNRNLYIIQIGKNVQEIEENAFRNNAGCVNFDRVYMDERNPFISGKEYGWLRSADGKIFYGAVSYLTLEPFLTNQFDLSGGSNYKIKLPEGVKEIRSLFAIPDLSIIQFPKSLKKISVTCLSGARKYCFEGDVPVITGERDEIYQDWLLSLISNDELPVLRVRKNRISGWFDSLTEGMTLSEEQESRLKRKLKKNAISG